MVDRTGIREDGKSPEHSIEGRSPQGRPAPGATGILCICPRRS
jgi:hypothetical protein